MSIVQPPGRPGLTAGGLPRGAAPAALLYPSSRYRAEHPVGHRAQPAALLLEPLGQACSPRRHPPRRGHLSRPQLVGRSGARLPLDEWSTTWAARSRHRRTGTSWRGRPVLRAACHPVRVLSRHGTRDRGVSTYRRPAYRRGLPARWTALRWWYTWPGAERATTRHPEPYPGTPQRPRCGHWSTSRSYGATGAVGYSGRSSVRRGGGRVRAALDDRARCPV